MDKLIIEKTKQTPAVSFDPDSGVFNMSGRSIPENTFDYYKPILTWLDGYLKNPQDKTIVKVHLEYFNTSSSKFILELFKKLTPINNDMDDKEVLVEWYYDEDDEEMMETGEDYMEVSGLTFELIEVEEE